MITCTTTAQAAANFGGRANKGGDILYRWGNPQAYRAGGPADQRLFDQHHVQWVAPGLPGEGNLLVFNNGNARGFSTVDEFVPPLREDGTYERAPGAPFGPERAVWSYGADAQPRFLSRTFGGVQRLPNGNTLICVSNMNRLIEVTPEGDVAWEADITPANSAFVGGGGSFRATRFPANYSGFRGTELFRAAPALVSAAAMRGGPLAPGALASAFGTLLAGFTANADATPLPIMLAGASVEVTDSAGVRRAAPLLFASPGQINFQVPAAAAVGPARVTLRGGPNGEQSADIRIDPVAPALFSANADGRGAGAILAVRVSAQGQSWEPAYEFDAATMRFVPKPLVLDNLGEQVFLLLFGTGIRRAIADGGITVTIGGRPVPVAAAAAHPQFTGVDQVNVGPLPPRLAGLRSQAVVLIAAGRIANPVTVSFQ